MVNHHHGKPPSQTTFSGLQKKIPTQTQVFVWVGGGEVGSRAARKAAKARPPKHVPLHNIFVPLQKSVA